MKKSILLLGALMLAFASFAAPWGHRYDVEQSEQNPTIIVGASVTMSVEWGEGDWQECKIGYGTSNDGTDWTWVDLAWFENDAVNENNKRCKADLTISEVGVYYYAYKFKKDDVVTYQLGSGDWSENSTDLSGVVSYITVSKEDYSGAIIASLASIVDIDSIAVNAEEGYEYAIILAGGDVATLVFQDDTVFNNLASNTSYDIYQRVKETSTYLASSSSEKLTVKTAFATQLSTHVSEEMKVSQVGGIIQIDLNSQFAQTAQVSVVNLSGQLAAQMMTQLTSGSNSIALSQHVESGVYVLQVQSGSMRLAEKIVVQ